MGLLFNDSDKNTIIVLRNAWQFWIEQESWQIKCASNNFKKKLVLITQKINGWPLSIELMQWSARSPDLTVLGFFLWVFHGFMWTSLRLGPLMPLRNIARPKKPLHRIRFKACALSWRQVMSAAASSRSKENIISQKNSSTYRLKLWQNLFIST